MCVRVYMRMCVCGARMRAHMHTEVAMTGESLSLPPTLSTVSGKLH